METTEKIVESYCRYMNGWFTISNIKCPSQYEIDLLPMIFKHAMETLIDKPHLERLIK
jgi:hypothetical protein